jgi:hypothetical protein
MKAGDKCPQCREGLLERDAAGLSCPQCSFVLELAEVVKANIPRTKVGDFEWKPKTFKIRIEDPEEAEVFLRGLILARQNNNSPYFVDLIDAVNTVLEPYREAMLTDQVAARG